MYIFAYQIQFLNINSGVFPGICKFLRLDFIENFVFMVYLLYFKGFPASGV